MPYREREREDRVDGICGKKGEIAWDLTPVNTSEIQPSFYWKSILIFLLPVFRHQLGSDCQPSQLFLAAFKLNVYFRGERLRRKAALCSGLDCRAGLAGRSPLPIHSVCPGPRRAKAALPATTPDFIALGTSSPGEELMLNKNMT
ncbi:Nitric Oxide Synthase, Endothelial [Manis pentadactyla]|nr:Nitric Oxide Synthase, Endothelial [Manis pentadactyla]